jgi:nitroimidazol reductase NimA-like FMN-containing flavoprotein (pyridoxamine 5'-phosphate oxidase superfamily)
VVTLSDKAPGLSVVALERAECMDLLSRAGIGRVVLSLDCIPVALPVNVAVLDEDVVFATDAGSKLDAAAQGNVVSVQVDDIDRVYHTGWSVLVTGVAELLTEPRDVDRARRLPLQPWAPGPHLYFVRVPSTVVSGRRITWTPMLAARTRQ